MKLKVYTGVEEASLSLVVEKNYTPDAKPRHTSFVSRPTRYIRIEILATHGPQAIIAEVAVGGTKQKPMFASLALFHMPGSEAMRPQAVRQSWERK